MRAAVVGGVAYHAGKKVQEGRYEDEMTQERLDQLETQQYQQQAAAAPPAGVMSDATIEQLKQLGDLKAQGILTDAEFDEQKRKLLAGT
jgi:hypothetical protein